LKRERALAAALLAAVLPAAAAPDEAALGKAAGYPHASLTPDFTLFADGTKVGNFTHMESIFWPREIGASLSPRPLLVAARELEATYPYGGTDRPLADLLERQRITGLLILKGDTVVFERYQYGRRPSDRFASFSMAKTVTALLVGIALREGAIHSLDDPASTYAPSLSGTAFGDVSLRTLLRMSSGARWSDRAVPNQASDVARLSGDTFFRRGAGGATALRDVRRRTPASIIRAARRSRSGLPCAVPSRRTSPRMPPRSYGNRWVRRPRPAG